MSMPEQRQGQQGVHPLPLPCRSHTTLNIRFLSQFLSQGASSMRTIPLALVVALLIAPKPVHAEDWHPAKGPLMTKWAKDVSPDKVHREYPRPQMVRKEWQNLNGLWEFALAKKDEEPPIGKKLDGQILVPFPI